MPPSVSDASQGFDRLHPEIRRWIWEQKWRELRDVQNQAIAQILDGDNDVLISATTAAGKTEAAFLPILTRVADRQDPGLSVLYVSPLKALINDQFRRLDLLCERMEIDVVRWHGDAPQSAKKRAIRDPKGVALITPESIEALLIRRPGDAKRLLGRLDFIVIDELHAFLAGPRGLHLACLLRRVDDLSGRRARRVGLSATIGDPAQAAAWLHPEAPSSVAQVESAAAGAELKLQVRGYVLHEDEDDDEISTRPDQPPTTLERIADHLFAALRGSNNLIFAGSRRRVEAVADRLRENSVRARVPNEFFPHHGSLSKELREELESRLKQGDLPTTAIATSTLELGIDIGSVRSVAQIGAPRSLASLRQRLGRSGRRQGSSSILRIYVREHALTELTDPLDCLRLETARSVAAVRLLIQRFVEPPSPDPALATVALQQTLSMIAQHGGAKADRLYSMICGGGPLSVIGKADYVELLRGMVAQTLIEQSPDGLIMLGSTGERVTDSRDFYAIFETNQEWRLVHHGRPLGTISISNAISVGMLVSFAGQRWRVESADDAAKIVTVSPHRAAKLPLFEGVGVEAIHDRLAAEMKAVLLSDDIPPYLDAQAVRLLTEGRDAFREMSLETERFIPAGRDTHVLLWRGTRMNDVFAVAMTAAGLECQAHDIGITIADTSPQEARALVRMLAEMPAPDPDDLSAFVLNLSVAKYDEWVPEGLLRRMWAKSNAAACSQLRQTAQELLGH